MCGAIKECLSKGEISPEQIAGVGIDGQSWSAIAIDKDGNVLTDTPIWMDTRAQEICDRLNNEIGSENIFEVAGNSLQPSYSTAKILWYKENMPEVYSRIYKILQSNSFIAYRIFPKDTDCIVLICALVHGMRRCVRSWEFQWNFLRKSFPAIR